MKRIVLNVLVFSLFASSLCAREYEEEPFDKESDRMARKHGDAEYEYQKQLAREAKMQQKAERKARRFGIEIIPTRLGQLDQIGEASRRRCVLQSADRRGDPSPRSGQSQRRKVKVESN